MYPVCHGSALWNSVSMEVQHFQNLIFGFVVIRVKRSSSARIGVLSGVKTKGGYAISILHAPLSMKEIPVILYPYIRGADLYRSRPCDTPPFGFLE